MWAGRLTMLTSLLCLGWSGTGNAKDATDGTYDDLVKIFQDVRMLERTNNRDGIPDYTVGTLWKVQQELKLQREKLETIDPSGWPIDRQVDYELVRAEMNGLDFFIRVLRPWARDPAYYALIWTEQSDTPSHEGPLSHAAIDLWTYSFPLSLDDAKKLTAQLQVIPPLLEQARINLTGTARDLWIDGIRNIRDQANDLDDLAKKTKDAGKEFQMAVAKAKSATVRFAEWLEKESPSKTDPSGIGKENYTWYLRHVLLVPLSWEEEVTLLRRELDRAYAMLALERQHNRNLPPLKVISSRDEYDRHADQSVTQLMSFLKEQRILPVRDYMEPALRRHMGQYQPEEKRNFFSNVMHSEPAVLYTHGTHWFDEARMRLEPHPSPIRREPQSFNIWVSRSEGLATAVEELFMHAGLYDDNPRVRELVWIMLAQRCARGLASLYAHANDITLEQARHFQAEWTPKGWTGELSLVAFEQQLYLRLPGYGPSYVSGKSMVDRLIKDRTRQLGDEFKLYDFFDDLYKVGMIPMSLIRWQMTGLNDEIRKINESK